MADRSVISCNCSPSEWLPPDDHYVTTSATIITPSEDPLSLQDLMNAICLISDLLIPHGMCLIT